ncbi:MAG: DMT family transporter, partial [Pseudomonadota bacterium]
RAGKRQGIRDALSAAPSAWTRLSDAQKGVALVLAVTFFFSCMDSAAKAMGERYNPLMVVWWRYAVAGALTLILLAPSLKRRLRTKRLPAQIFRSSLLFGATILFFIGFSLMPQVDVVALAQVAPLAMTGMAALFLGERVGPWRWLGVAAGFGGALLVVKPGFSDTGWAALFPLAGALFFAAYSIATRALGGGEPAEGDGPAAPGEDPWTTFLYTGLVGAVAATFMIPFTWETPAAVDLPILMAAGLFGALGQGTLIFALLFAPASLLAPYLYVGLIWGALFGYVLFNHVPDAFTVAGGGVIVAAGLFVRWREAQAAQQAERAAAARAS